MGLVGRAHCAVNPAEIPDLVVVAGPSPSGKADRTSLAERLPDVMTKGVTSGQCGKATLVPAGGTGW